MAKQLPKTIAEKYIEGVRDQWPGLESAGTRACEKLRQAQGNQDPSEIDCYYAAAVDAMVASGMTIDEIRSAVQDEDRRENIIEPEDVYLDIAWKTCKQVYRFDAVLVEELASQDMPGKIPIDILKMMPYKVQFIEAMVDVPTTAGTVWPAKGFFAYIEKWRGNERLILRFVLDDGGATTIGFNLDGKETIEDFLLEIKRNLEGLIEKGERTWEEGADENFARCFSTIFNLLLYLNAENADTEVVYRASGKSSKHKISQATIFAVGSRVGAELGAARIAYVGEASAAAITGKKKAPHWRRGHFHTYVGRHADGTRTYTVKWQPAMMVAVGNLEEQSAEIVHEAKSSK